MLIGGILVTPFTKVWNVTGHWDIVTVSMTIGVVFLGTIVSFSCYLHGISMLGPVQGSMLGCVEPLVATILSATVAWTGLWNDRCCGDSYGYCWSGDGIDGQWMRNQTLWICL